MSSWFDRLPRSQYSSLKRISTSESWFQVYEIRPRIFAIYEPYQYEEVISYLILGSERSLLIDTGMGIGNLAKVVEELSSNPLIVINTHTHHDHIGDNWRFQQSLIGVENDFSKKNYQELFLDAQDEVKDGAIREEYLPTTFDRKSYTIKPFSLSRYITDGESIDLGNDQEIQIIFTPGHTPDSISLVDKKERILFVGDTFYQGPIYLHRPETNLPEYIQSLARLVQIIQDYQIELICPAHNIPNVRPELLISAHHAIQNLPTGTRIADDHLEYKFADFSFVLHS